MTFGSLFAGVGGFDLGFERAGMRCTWQVENEPFCCKVLERHWPHVARFGDVREWACNRAEHCVDCIAAGFPCQDLSIAGRRAGLAGSRSGLFHHVIRVASDLRPDWLVLENVPGLLSSNNGRDMEAVIGKLADIGYCCAWRVLDARHFGVPQRRRRVFIVGNPDPARAAAVLFESDDGERNPAPMRKNRQDIATSLGRGADKRGNDRVIGTITTHVGRCGFGDPVNDGIIWEPVADTSIVPAGNRAMSGLPGPLDVCGVCSNGSDAPRYRTMANAVVPAVAEWIGRRLMSVAEKRRSCDE